MGCTCRTLSSLNTGDNSWQTRVTFTVFVSCLSLKRDAGKFRELLVARNRLKISRSTAAKRRQSLLARKFELRMLRADFFGIPGEKLSPLME